MSGGDYVRGRGSRMQMDWIRLHKRLAIYVRDGFDCQWCQGVFPLPPLGHGLALDHVDPDGPNEPENLITSCLSCNSAKRDLSVREWSTYMREHLGIDARLAWRRVRKQLRRKIDLERGLVLALQRRPKYQTRALTMWESRRANEKAKVSNGR